MSRKSDSYDSLIRGVSEQTAHDRLPGQHWEQENIISDPVRGMARRHGSQFMDYQYTVQPPDAFADADVTSRLEDTIFVSGVEYGVFRRDGTVPSSIVQPLLVVNKDTRKFVPVQSTVEADNILREGISAICVVGRFVLASPARRIVQHTVTDNRTPTAGYHAVWLRGGAYSRTYTVTVTKPDGTSKDYSYTTMKSYYDQPLDTSDIPHLDPTDPTKPNVNYTKLVNDRTNAYNSAVNKHIADAAKDITPENLAQKLAELILVDWPTTGYEGPYITLPFADVVLSADDGGNGEFIRAVSRTVTSPDLLTPKHFVDKVITIQPKSAGSLPYYLKAVSATGGTGFTEVTWVETAGDIVSVTNPLLIGAFYDGKLMMAESAAALAAVTGLEVPGFESSSSGDVNTRPVPQFMGRTISYMRMFQDRLMIIAGAVVFMSRTGDYFNWFAASALTLKPDDPIEVFAQGAEDDTITSGVKYDRNVVLFGQRFQYIIPGKESMTPNNAYVGVAATYEGANLVAPAAAGAVLFFCQKREGRLTMQQMQPGAVADRLEAFDTSSQLDGYLRGTPKQLVAQTSPSTVFVKTAEFTDGFYVYGFLDSNDQSERLFDSWSHWRFHKVLGKLVGITGDDSGLLAVTLRGDQFVLDRFTRETDLSDRPYMDSARKLVGSSGTTLEYDVAYDVTSPRFLIGGTISEAASLNAKYPDEVDKMWTGTGYDSFFTLTSPYLRDYKDRVILDAKLAITKLSVSVTKSAALYASVSLDEGKTYKVTGKWVARRAGTWVLNTQAVDEQSSTTVPIMKDNKKYRARLASHKWLPLTVSVVEWSGQVFTSRR